MDATEVTESLQRYTDEAVELSMAYGPKLLLAILTLFIGLWLIRLLHRGIDAAMLAADLDLVATGAQRHLEGPFDMAQVLVARAEERSDPFIRQGHLSHRLAGIVMDRH